MRILYPHPWDADDPNVFAGTTKYLKDALIGGGAEVVSATLTQSFPARARNTIFMRLTKKRFLSSHSFWQADHLGSQVERILRRERFDAVLSTSSIVVSRLQTDVPKFFYTDATVRLIEDYFTDFPFTKQSAREADAVERSAILGSRRGFYSSEWARSSAIRDYGAAPSKIEVIPFGANLSHAPTAQEVATHIAERTLRPCRFLFIGKQWERKGGDKAVQIVEALQKQGVPAILTVLGEPPPVAREWLRAPGIISKSTPEGSALFNKTLLEHDFFLLPTKADCTPIVLAEASAYGLPSITHDVGGVSSMLEPDKTGLLFEESASPETIAASVRAIVDRPERYRAMASHARERYETVHSWSTVAKRLIGRMELLTGNSNSL